MGKGRIYIGTSPLTNTIFAGGVLKDGRTWASNRQDVTGMACAAVCEHVLARGAPVTVTGDGVPMYRITVERIDKAEAPANG